MTTLAVIYVSWNTRDLLDTSIASVHYSLQGSGIRYRVLVVDNASSDGTPAMLHSAHPEAELIETGANLGFAAGNNRALRQLLAEEQPPEFVLLLNPDTEVQEDAIPQMVAYLQQHPKAVVAGPLLRYADGTPQSSRRRLPNRGVFFLESTPLETLFPNNRWARHYRMDDTPADHVQAVDWLVGAALLVRTSVITRAGLLDEGFAMYSEELEWQQRLGRHGKVVFLPNAVITHYEGQSSDQAPARRYLNFHQSRLRYVRMMVGPEHALGLWVFLLLVYGWELASEAAKWLLGHRRELRAQRVHVYAAFLQGLLAGPNT